MSLGHKAGFLTCPGRISMVRAALRAAGPTESRYSARVESMADGTQDEGDRKGPPDDEAQLSARLQRLGERLAHHQGANRKAEADPGPRSDPSAMARGFRLSTELVAGVLVGAFIGWAIDRWLGISPWGMFVFLLLGFAAGVINVIRAAGISSRPDPKQ